MLSGMKRVCQKCALSLVNLSGASELFSSNNRSLKTNSGVLRAFEIGCSPGLTSSQRVRMCFTGNGDVTHQECTSSAVMEMWLIGNAHPHWEYISSPGMHIFYTGRNMYTADNIRKMIEFLIVSNFVRFGGCLFHEIIGIPMGTNCDPLLADLFLHSYENEFLGNMIKSGQRRCVRSFNLGYRYTDDLIVFDNKKILHYFNKIYPSQLTFQKANKSDPLADYLDLTFIIDSGGKLSTRLYGKCNDFDCLINIVNCPFFSRSIQSDQVFLMLYQGISKHGQRTLTKFTYIPTVRGLM